jgi:hypothetical protein
MCPSIDFLIKRRGRRGDRLLSLVEVILPVTPRWSAAPPAKPLWCAGVRGTGEAGEVVYSQGLGTD